MRSLWDDEMAQKLEAKRGTSRRSSGPPIRPHSAVPIQILFFVIFHVRNYKRRATNSDLGQSAGPRRQVEKGRK